MGPRLKDPNSQIPFGLRFVIPPIKWQSPPNASLHVITASAIQALQGNPHVAKKLGWDLSYESMLERVNLYNAAVCKANGWLDYIHDDGSVGAALPFPTQNQPGPLQSLKNAAVGGKSIVSWIASGAEAVAPELSNKRAEVCAKCPMNEKGDLLSFFTREVAEAILVAYNQRRDWKMFTTSDHLLSVCAICSCPMKLKVHFGIDRIWEALTPEQKQGLPDNCWIPKEANAATNPTH